MNHYAAWKNTLIVFFLIISSLYAIPNIYGSDLAIQVTGTGNYVVDEKDLNNINTILLDNDVEFKSISIDGRNIFSSIWRFSISAFF